MRMKPAELRESTDTLMRGWFIPKISIESCDSIEEIWDHLEPIFKAQFPNRNWPARLRSLATYICPDHQMVQEQDE